MHTYWHVQSDCADKRPPNTAVLILHNGGSFALYLFLYLFYSLFENILPLLL